MFVATVIYLKDSESPIKVRNRSRPTHVRVIHRTVNLEDVKFVKNATNAVSQSIQKIKKEVNNAQAKSGFQVDEE